MNRKLNGEKVGDKKKLHKTLQKRSQRFLARRLVHRISLPLFEG